MSYVSEKIETTLASAGITTEESKVKAFYITFSSSNYKVGNTGSLATSMLIEAGGNAVTVDESKAKPTYAANPVELIEKYGTKTVVFVDNSITKDDAKLTELKNMIPSDVKLVPLDPLWNNFSIDSMTGVWTMAVAMYPSLFSGDVPDVPKGNDQNTSIYSIAAVIAVVAIIGVAYYFMKK